MKMLFGDVRISHNMSSAFKDAFMSDNVNLDYKPEYEYIDEKQGFLDHAFVHAKGTGVSEFIRKAQENMKMFCVERYPTFFTIERKRNSSIVLKSFQIADHNILCETVAAYPITPRTVGVIHTCVSNVMREWKMDTKTFEHFTGMIDGVIYK